jgi:putative ABC transport system substrate-binding protein
MIQRRDFITLLGGAAAAWPIAARAQRPTMPVIGILYSVSAAEWADRMAGVRRGLAQTGFVEGRNVAIEYRFAEGHFEQIPWMAADLIGLRVAAILAGGSTTSVRNLLKVAHGIPVVFTSGVDPVETGLVASLNRPGGNATGVTLLSGELGAKKLELLHEVVPATRKIAILTNQSNQASLDVDIRIAQAAAPRLGLETVVVSAGSESEISAAFASAVQQGVGAILIGADALYSGPTEIEQVTALARQYRLASISGQSDAVRAGQLMSYGINDVDMYRQAGVYIGRILKGEKAGDLPVVQPTKFELAVNLKTAKALGVTVPQTLLALADEVIE